MVPKPQVRIAFYNDSPIFGGHEVMTIRGVRALAQDGRFEIHFLYSRDNRRLGEALQGIRDTLGAGDAERMVAVPTDFTSRKLDALRNFVSRGRANLLAEQLREVAPALLVVAQGDIESGCLAFFAARKSGVRCVSYIPIPHRLSDMGAALAPMRDTINAPLFRIPEAFITISRTMKRKLRDRGVDQPIHVVFNGIDAGRFTASDQAAEREALGLPPDVKIAGMAGRIEFNQKCQDLLLGALAHVPDWHAAFVGEGPDEPKLRRLPNELGIDESRVHFLSWSDRPEHFFRAIDLLTLPSRYEGFPLVMLESVCCGTPVVASDADGMSEFLPKIWRFPKGDAAALGKILREFSAEGYAAETGRLREDVMARMTKASFAAGFVETIAELVER